MIPALSTTALWCVLGALVVFDLLIVGLVWLVVRRLDVSIDMQIQQLDSQTYYVPPKDVNPRSR